MSRLLLTHICLSTLFVMSTAASLMAQPVAPRPEPPAKDREPHYKSRPQEVAPRIRVPNTDAQGNKALPPHPDDDEPVLKPEDTKPSEIRSTVSTPKTSKPVMQAAKVDTVLASFVAFGNHEAIILGGLAGERSQSSAVQDFAATVAQEHGDFLNRLKRFAPDAAKPGYLNFGLPPIISEPIAGRGAATSEIALGSRNSTIAKTEIPEVNPDEAKALALPDSPLIPTDSSGRTVQLLAIERDLAGVCLASHQQMLAQKRGGKFDQCYMAQQVGLHLAMKNKLSVYRRHVSPELAVVFGEGEKMVAQHLQKAQELMDSLETEPAAAVTTPSPKRTIGSDRIK